MLVSIKESEGVYYAVRTGFLDIIQNSEGFKDAINYFVASILNKYGRICGRVLTGELKC